MPGKGNSEFCFPLTLNVPRGRRNDRKLTGGLTTKMDQDNSGFA